ncbi:polysaccharide biosynthesis/export family protein [Xanthobacter sp. KR7-65]
MVEPGPELSNAYMPQNRPPGAEWNACPGSGGVGTDMPASTASLHRIPSVPLSPGDEVDVRVYNDTSFTGVFSVNMDGTLTVPYLKDLKVAGLTTDEAEKRFARALVDAGFYPSTSVRVSIKPKRWAPIQISVAGAVFQPGRALVGERKPEIVGEDQLGDSTPGRYLSYAIKGAGGIRPYADLRHVQFIRGQHTRTIDLTGVFTGAAVDDPPIIFGDRVVVPSSGCIQSNYIRPSQITPPGIRVFLSNLTVPAAGNAQSAVTTQATNVPYGTRLLQGAISANCVGGTRTVNAARSVVLVTRNPITGETEVVERSIEALVTEKYRDAVNPYLMPGDGLACYDSAVTNGRQVAGTISEILATYVIARGL